MFALNTPSFMRHKTKIEHIRDISNPKKRLNPVFIERQAQKAKKVIAYEYVDLLNGKETDTYRVSIKHDEWHETTFNSFICELFEDFISWQVRKKKITRKYAETIHVIVPFPRLVPLAKSLKLVTIMAWEDKFGNKYEFGMRLIYAKEQTKKGKK